MRYPTSKIYRMALYAHHVCGLQTFTSLELYYIGLSASAWYTAHLSDITLARERQIKADHGFTEDEWREVMGASHTFYFSPTAEMTACNNDLRKLLGRRMIINGSPYYTTYCRALIRNAIKRGVLEYVDRSQQPFVYRINPLYVDNPNMPEED